MDEQLAIEAIRRGLVKPEEVAGLIPLPEGDMGKQAAEGVASIGHGVIEAGKGLVGLPAMIQGILRSLPESKALGPSPIPPLPLPTGEDVGKAVGNVTGMSVFQPHTPEQMFISRAAQGGASMPGSLASVLLGAGSGIAGEAAHNALPESGWSRPVAEIATMLLGLPSSISKPQPVRAVQEYLKELGKPGIEKAQAVREAVTARTGVPTILTQGTEAPTSLSGITSEIRQTPMGMEVNKVLDAQTPAMQDQVSRLVAQLSGKSLNQETANEVLAAGKQAAYRGPEGAVAAATKPLYEAAAQDKVPLFGMQGSINQLAKDLLSAKGERNLGLAPGGDVVDRYVKRLGKLEAPPTAAELDALGRSATAAASASYKEGATPSLVLGRQGYEAAGGPITAAAKAASPALSGGKMVHATGQEWLVNPAQKGPLGVVFPESVVNKGIGDFDQLASKLDSLEAGDIADVAGRLRKVDPQAFPAIVKHNITGKVDPAFEAKGGRTSAAALNEIPNQLIGTPAKKAAFEAMISEVHQDPAAGKAAVQLLEDMRVLSREQGSRGVVGADLREEASNNPITRFLRNIGIIYPAKGLSSLMQRGMYKDTYQKIADALVDPDGAQQLIDIAKYSMTKQRTKNISRALLGVGVQEQGNQY